MFSPVARSKVLFECQTRPADLIHCGKLLVVEFTTQVVRILRSSMMSVDQNRSFVYTEVNGSWQDRKNVT